MSSKRPLSTPTVMGRLKRLTFGSVTLGVSGRAVAARFGLWALLLQIILPLGQGIPLPSGADGVPRHLVVCSANGGLRTVPLPGSGQQSSSTASSACAVCLSYGAGSHLDLPPPVLTPLPRLAGLAVIDQVAQTEADPISFGIAQPRAPPLAAA